MHKEKNLCGVAIKHKAVDTLREYMRLTRGRNAGLQGLMFTEKQ